MAPPNDGQGLAKTYDLSSAEGDRWAARRGMRVIGPIATTGIFLTAAYGAFVASTRPAGSFQQDFDFSLVAIFVAWGLGLIFVVRGYGFSRGPAKLEIHLDGIVFEYPSGVREILP